MNLGVKALGNLKLPDFCPRCFWLTYHYPIEKEQTYSTLFPGVLSTIDSYIKKVIPSFFKNPSKSFPSWLQEFVEKYHIAKPLEEGKKKYEWTIGNITLTGIPDMVFVLEDKQVLIVDFKTAKLNENQKSFLPLYETQLNGYAYLLEKQNISVKHLALVYLEPKTDEKNLNLDLFKDHFSLSFDFTIKEVEKWKPEEIEELAKEAEGILSSEKPPEGRPGCKKCENFNEWLKNILDIFPSVIIRKAL